MKINAKEHLLAKLTEQGLPTEGLQLPDVELDTDGIRVVMISEVPPANPDDGFYSKAADPNYLRTTIPLFREAGADVQNIDDIIALGVYITTAAKTPKDGYTVDRAVLDAHLLILQAELALFPNAKIIMLMGDVAKKAYNAITKKATGKNVIPSGSTYKIRGQEFTFGDVRVIPSYIITGGNLLIEKGKMGMIAEDIGRMLALL